MDESFSQLFQRDQSTEYKLGNIISGKVVKIRKDSVVVSVGLKSDGEIPIEQFRKKDGKLEAEEGDLVEVTLEAIEDGYGETKLSREKAKRTKTWNYLQQAADDDLVVQGMIVNKIKGGFVVDFDGVSAFLPGSLVDIRPVRDPGYLSGRMLDFKVIKIDVLRNNAVVSRRAVVESEYSGEREDLFSSIQQGSVVTGIVKNLTDYGAFLDLGGLDGLLHITDMSWARIRHPSHLLSIGQEVKVKVLEYDKEKMRVSLGLKQMEASPWNGITERYGVGDVTTGKVTNVTDYGCFVEIKPGIEGLVHVSEMDWSNKNIHPSKVVSPNQEVEVMILEIDTERHRLSLGIKQTKPNPWKIFSERYKKGDVLAGVIKLITDFGIFIHFKEFNIDGLVHISDITWNEEPANNKTIRNYKKGKEQTVMILSIDAERERISLGIKQLMKKRQKAEKKNYKAASSGERGGKNKETAAAQRQAAESDDSHGGAVAAESEQPQ